MQIIGQELHKETLLLANYHAASTLTVYGYDVDCIIISKNQSYLLRKEKVMNGVIQDHYFNISYMLQETKDYLDLIDNGKKLIVARDDIIFAD